MTASFETFAGSLIGQCLGDAFGFPIEGASPEVAAAYVDEFVRQGRVPAEGAPGFAFGQYSDDSQMARELVASVVERGGFDGADYARRIAALFAEERIVGYGATTAQAARRLLSGASWHEAGTPAPAAGNGSAMRAGPVGLFCGDDARRLVDMARDQGRITHADPRCCAGAVAIAGAVALAQRPGPVRADAFLATLQGWTQGIEPTMATALRQLQDHLKLPREEAVRLIANAGLPPGVNGHWRGGISGFVVGSVLWAIYAFLTSPDNYLDAVATAIWPGGDVDTTAAMTGAISGARLGLAGLPDVLARRVNDRGGWGYAELLDLARRASPPG